MATRLRVRNSFDFGYEIVLIMSRVVVNFVSLKYFETDHVFASLIRVILM